MSCPAPAQTQKSPKSPKPPCTAIPSPHALLLIHRMHCNHFITSTTITSSHVLISLHHMHCYHFITCTVITSSHALLSYARPLLLACMTYPYFFLVCLVMLPHTRTQMVPLYVPDWPTLSHGTMSVYAAPLTYHTRISCWVSSCCCPVLVSGLLPRPYIFVCMSSHTPGKKAPHHLVRRMRG